MPRVKSPGMVTSFVQLPPALHRRLKATAALAGVSMPEVFRQAVEVFLAKKPK
jgi:hypothetical protein